MCYVYASFYLEETTFPSGEPPGPCGLLPHGALRRLDDAEDTLSRSETLLSLADVCVDATVEPDQGQDGDQSLDRQLVVRLEAGEIRINPRQCKIRI